MAITTGCMLQMKLLIEKRSQKVLFAEVGKKVVDFLLSLLSLPIGSVTKLITEESTFRPLSNTYNSWEQLDHNFLSSSRMTANSLVPVISPTSSSNFALLLSSASPATAKEYVYKLDCNCNKFTDVRPSGTKSIYCQSCCKSCPYTPLTYVGPGVTKEKVERDGYVQDDVIYFLMDDLSMVPMKPIASIALLNKMGHKDLSRLEEKTVSLDDEQVIKLCFFVFSISMRLKYSPSDIQF